MVGPNLPGGGDYAANLHKRVNYRDSNSGGGGGGGRGSEPSGPLGLAGSLVVIGWILMASKQGGWAVACWVAGAITWIVGRNR